MNVCELRMNVTIIFFVITFGSGKSGCDQRERRVLAKKTDESIRLLTLSKYQMARESVYERKRVNQHHLSNVFGFLRFFLGGGGCAHIDKLSFTQIE